MARIDTHYTTPRTPVLNWRDVADRYEYLTRGQHFNSAELMAEYIALGAGLRPYTFRDRQATIRGWLIESGWPKLADELRGLSEPDVPRWWRQRLGPFSIATNEYAALAKHQLSRLDLGTVQAAISEQWEDADGYKLRLTDGELIFRLDGDWMRMVDLREDTYRAPIKYPDNRGRHSRTVTVDFHVGYDDRNETAYVRRIRRSDVVAFDTVDGMRVRVPDDEIEPEFYLSIPPALRVEWADKSSQTGVQTVGIVDRKGYEI